MSTDTWTDAQLATNQQRLRLLLSTSKEAILAAQATIANELGRHPQWEDALERIEAEISRRNRTDSARKLEDSMELSRSLRRRLAAIGQQAGMTDREQELLLVCFQTAALSCRV
jgi:hypothetical protein